MLLVHTQEITADFAGFPLSVSIPPDCSCSEDPRMGCSDCGTKTLTIHAAQRDDGAVPQSFTFRAKTDDMRRVLREALDMLGPTEAG